MLVARVLSLSLKRESPHRAGHDGGFRRYGRLARKRAKAYRWIMKVFVPVRPEAVVAVT